MNASSICGIPVDAPPESIFDPEPMPSGDTCDSIGLFLNPATRTLQFKRARFESGPSSLMQSIDLPGNVGTLLATPPGSDGMRGGLAGYIPRGVWDLEGRVVIAGPAGVEYDFAVTQGHTEDPDRPGIIAGNAQTVGGGVGVSAGADHMPLSYDIRAYNIMFAGERGQANELLVWCYPKCAGHAGAALASVAAGANGGGLPMGLTSIFTLRRCRDL